jgi:hypothetical protein
VSMSENIRETTYANGGARGCEGVTPAHARDSPESAGERKIRNRIKKLDELSKIHPYYHSFISEAKRRGLLDVVPGTNEFYIIANWPVKSRDVVFESERLRIECVIRPSGITYAVYLKEEGGEWLTGYIMEGISL